MLTCKEVSRLVSESLDHPLPVRRRVAVRLHLVMCNLCRSYRSQMLALRQVIRRYADADDPGLEGAQMPARVLDRIKRALQEQRGRPGEAPLEKP